MLSDLIRLNLPKSAHEAIKNLTQSSTRMGIPVAISFQLSHDCRMRQVETSTEPENILLFNNGYHPVFCQHEYSAPKQSQIEEENRDFLSWWGQSTTQRYKKDPEIVRHLNGRSSPQGTDMPGGYLEAECESCTVTIVPEYIINLSLDASLAGVAGILCQTSPTFCRSFHNYALYNGCCRKPFKRLLSSNQTSHCETVQVGYLVNIHLHTPNQQVLDYKW